MDDHVITKGTNASTSMMDIKLWAFAVFSSFLLYSFIANIILLIVLCKNESISINRTFTYVSLQLIICSFISYISQVAIVLPETLYEDLFNEHKTSFIYRFGIFTQIFAFFAILIFLFLLALTRYVFFNLPRFDYIFTGTKMHLIAAFMWLLVTILTISDMHFCKQEFDGTHLQWIRKYDGSRMGSQLKVFMECLTFGLPIISFIMHIAIFNNLRQKRNSVSPHESGENHNISCITEIYKCRFIKLAYENNERNKQEIIILIQGAIFCALVELEMLSFDFLRTIFGTSDDKANIRMNIFVNCTIICLSAIQPTVYFICNKRIRHYVVFELVSKLKTQNSRI